MLFCCCFCQGFCELIPSYLLRPFDERELELVIGGISSIDVNDWRNHTRLKQCTPETQQVVWFWQVIIHPLTKHFNSEAQ